MVRPVSNQTWEEYLAKKQPLPFADMSQWDKSAPRPRESAVPDCIPLGQPTLFAGDGGVGKTLLDLQRNVATVLGREWLGMVPAAGPVIFLNAEDFIEELHRRLAPILACYKVTFAEIVRAGFHLLPLAGKDAVLGRVENNTVVETPLFSQLREAALSIKPRSISLDALADVFAGDENDRSQARQFVGILRGLAISINTGVVLLAHPSVAGMSTGRGYSGSTAWHNSVRARLYLRTIVNDQYEEIDTSVRELVMMKNQYASNAGRMRLRWNNGLYLPEQNMGPIERTANDQRTEEIFLTLLNQYNQQGRNVSPNPGKNYAPKVFEGEQAACGTKRKAFESAMSRLFAADKIHIGSHGPSKSRQYASLLVGARGGTGGLVL